MDTNRIERIYFDKVKVSIGATRPVWLEITKETDLFLIGVEWRADRDGFADATDRTHLIDKKTIKARKPAYIDRKYGNLKVGTE